MLLSVLAAIKLKMKVMLLLPPHPTLTKTRSPRLTQTHRLDWLDTRTGRPKCKYKKEFSF
jgi:hypothetical protein